jgi:hypothetical protein
VKSSAADLTEMLGHAAGGRRIPVIVEEDRVTVGYGGT